jgi:hypothetical protein
MKSPMSVSHSTIKLLVNRSSLFLLVACLLLAACEGKNPTASTGSTDITTGGEVSLTVNIAQILADPAKFVGTEVDIIGYYRGWNLLGEATGKSPVTRSDWVVKDDGGAIYVQAVSGMSPNLEPGSKTDTDRIVHVIGTVRVTSDNQPYIEPSSVVLVETDTTNKPASTSQVTLKDNLYQPKAGDESMTRGKAFFDSVLFKDKGDGTATLTFKGSLPTPCNELRLEFSNVGSELIFTGYSVIAKDQMCTEVIQPFEFELVLQNLGTAQYTVKVNDQVMLR